MDRDLKNAFEFLPGRLYYVPLSSKPGRSKDKHYFCIDTELIYWNFFLDYGPLNLGHLVRFCDMLNAKLEDPKLQNKIIMYYSGSHAHKRTNAAFLICAWAILYLHKTPDEAYAPFRNVYPPFPPWHDATPNACYFNLTVLDTLNGLYKAHILKYFDLDNFNLAEYEHFEQVENGDLNWCMNNKFIAFAGPQACKEAMEGYFALAPEDYVPYFKKKNVTLVVRFNKKYYDARRFTTAGIDHSELYFLDGTTPPEHILNKFLRICEETPGAVAVHCKAGLGRTGTCIGCYMMKHHRLTAEEAIGWLRIVRPGSVIGPQQQYMKDIQARMWREGDMMRTRLGASLSAEVDDVSSAVAALSIGRDGPDNIMGASAKPDNSTEENGKEGNGDVSQGDMLRARRMHGHHITTSEPKQQSSSAALVRLSKGTPPQGSGSTISTRPHIGRLLGRRER